ncbi:VOC family protein [Longivirga aurantiaca]|uniref:VOC family protein n=1 Tax=Longivirga aurantiaca TaxID=1837743 RepID=A0ABW1SZV7_9ACTN
MSRRGTLHHLEIWVPDLARAEASWGWLLERLGYTLDASWPAGRTWLLGTAYLSIEAGPDVVEGPHERLRPGMNHVAFWAGSRTEVDALVVESGHHGWTLLFAERHPYAGGPEHYAAYLADPDGYEVELVADPLGIA